jgi:hypothetical protein
MNPDILFAIFLRNLGINLPALCALVIAVMVTYANWHRHPTVARWAMLAFVSRIFSDLLNIAWHSFGFFLILPNAPWLADNEVGLLMVLSGLEALGYVFMLCALNAARTPYRRPLFYDDFLDDDRPRRSSEDAGEKTDVGRTDDKISE